MADLSKGQPEKKFRMPLQEIDREPLFVPMDLPPTPDSRRSPTTASFMSSSEPSFSAEGTQQQSIASNTRGVKHERTSSDDDQKSAKKVFCDDRAHLKKDETDLPTGSVKQSKARGPWIRKLLQNAESRNMTVQEVNSIFQAFKKRNVVPADNDRVNLRGMNADLYMHQFIGAGLMRLREEGEDECKGGILADQMGLGKTLMALANVINARQVNPEAKKLPTLVVASPAIASQWYSEIHIHCDLKALGGVIRYFGTERFTSSDNGKVLRHYGMILTTYGEIVASYKDLQDGANAEPSRRSSGRFAMFHKMHFYRVILDEAAKIKNRDTQTSKACRALTATCRWAISGTIVSNGPEEYYPMFAMIGVPGVSSFRSFKKLFYDEDDTTNEAFALQLAAVEISRVGDSKVLGSKILDLPMKEERDILIIQNPVESRLSEREAKHVRRATAKKLRKLKSLQDPNEAEAPDLSKLMKKTYHLMMRERQLTTNPLLVLHLTMAHLGVEEAKELIRESCGSSTTFSDKDVNLMLKLFQEAKSRDDVIQKGKQQKELQKQVSTMFPRSQRPSVKPNTGKSKGKPSSANFGSSRPGSLKKDKKVHRMKVQEWFKKGGKVLENAKTREAKKQMAAWIAEDPTKKMLVFTLWLDEITILEKICEGEGWEYRSYHGGKTQKTRENALKHFHEEPGCQVLLISLLAGGEGLNIAAACRAILLDPWFNKAKEDQAFARMFRMGQVNETTFVRMLAQGTVDERMVRIQSVKQDLIDAVIKRAEDGSHGLSWTHLYEAFGEVLGYDKDKWADLEDIDNEVSDTDGDLDDIDIDANADADAEDVELATDTGEDNDSGEDDEDFIPVDMEAELGDNTETRFADGVDGFVTRDDLGNYLDGFQN